MNANSQDSQGTLANLSRSRKVAVALALASVVAPVAGWHKFYLKQPVWGVIYLLLSWTPIPRVASAIEGVWYLAQDVEEFNQRFNGTVSIPGRKGDGIDPNQVGAIAEAVRKLDQLRADGLISEYEFEQKRRKLLDQIA